MNYLQKAEELEERHNYFKLQNNKGWRENKNKAKKLRKEIKSNKGIYIRNEGFIEIIYNKDYKKAIEKLNKIIGDEE